MERLKDIPYMEQHLNSEKDVKQPTIRHLESTAKDPIDTKSIQYLLEFIEKNGTDICYDTLESIFSPFYDSDGFDYFESNRYVSKLVIYVVYWGYINKIRIYRSDIIYERMQRMIDLDRKEWNLSGVINTFPHAQISCSEVINQISRVKVNEMVYEPNIHKMKEEISNFKEDFDKVHNPNALPF